MAIQVSADINNSGHKIIQKNYISFWNCNRTVRIKVLNHMGGIFPHFVIFAKWWEDKINNYSGFNAMQMGLLYKPCKGREREITTSLLSMHLIYIRNNLSEAHKKSTETPYSINRKICSMRKIWPSDDWFGNVPERNQHLNKLIYCILFQIILITSILCFFASRYCFLSCWLTVIISPGINLIWNNIWNASICPKHS